MRIYVDTSVIGGCEDDEFAEHSIQLMESFMDGRNTLALSSLTVNELSTAPIEVRNRLASVPEAHVEKFSLDEAAKSLAEAYIIAGVLPEDDLADAQHIAIATLGRVDALVSWNFRHIVNLQRILGYNAVNARLGHSTIEIRTPREVLEDEQD
jgi:hypothetical protein